MSFNDRPDCTVPPDDQRCEAWCKPQSGTWQAWTKVWRRCCRPSNQGRNGIMVCHIHARSEALFKEARPDLFPPLKARRPMRLRNNRGGDQ